MAALSVEIYMTFFTLFKMDASITFCVPMTCAQSRIVIKHKERAIFIPKTPLFALFHLPPLMEVSLYPAQTVTKSSS
ncbi:MAG: hypothetical protein WAW77_15260, partial [Caldibacillus thermoamylovorans]